MRIHISVAIIKLFAFCVYTFQCTQVSIALSVCDEDSFTCLCDNVYCNNDDGVFEFVNSDVSAFEYTQVFNSGSVCNN